MFSSLIDDLINIQQNSTKNLIEQLIFKYIPLNISKSSTFNYRELHTINEFKSYMKSCVNNATTIEDIAVLALEMCQPYIKYDMKPPLITDTFNSLDSIKSITFNQILQDFTSFTQDTLNSDLKDFLFFSYFYSSSFMKADINCIDKVQINDVSKNSPRDFSDHLGRFYNAAPTFLHTFFHFIKEPSKKNPEESSEESPKKKFLLLRSSYDVELLTKIIKSPNYKNNPFVDSSNEKSSTKTNLLHFLKNCSGLTLDSTLSDLSNTILSKTKNKETLSSYAVPLYNQFFLERLSNINFINKLHSFYKQNASLQPDTFLFSLDLFSLSPLLNYRLKIIEFHHEKFYDYKNQWTTIQDWNTFLLSLLRQQVTCTIPILDLIFHYLMALYKNKNNEPNILQERDRYFENIVKKNNFEFYKNDKIIILKKALATVSPTRSHFPMDILDSNYINLVDKIYSKFFKQISYLDVNSLFSQNTLFTLHTQQIDFFTQTLCNLSLPSNPASPFGMTLPFDKK